MAPLKQAAPMTPAFSASTPILALGKSETAVWDHLYSQFHHFSHIIETLGFFIWFSFLQNTFISA